MSATITKLLSSVGELNSKVDSFITSQTANSEEYLTISEAANFLKISKSRLYKATSKREIKHIKNGKVLRFRRSDLVAWLETASVNQAA